MRKLWLLIGALAVLVLAACTGSAGVTATPRAPTVRSISTTSTPTATTAPIAAATIQAPLPTSEPATCTAASRQPTPGPTEPSLFPGVSPADWKLGPDGAKVVFIEYSDFQ